MTLREATASFLVHLRRDDSTLQPQLEPTTAEKGLQLLEGYFSPTVKPREISSDRLRDFLTRRYVDTTCSLKPPGVDQLPDPCDLLNTLTTFLTWADKELHAEIDGRCFTIIKELSSTLPRALEITNSLSSWLRERGGAFVFPEFLTSFEAGGRSEYDIDDSDDSEEAGALDGYFRIDRVEGLLVETEELISGRRVWPILFPARVAALLALGYIINLEVVRLRDCWEITGCGVAYPPGTDV